MDTPKRAETTRSQPTQAEITRNRSVFFLNSAGTSEMFSKNIISLVPPARPDLIPIFKNALNSMKIEQLIDANLKALLGFENFGVFSLIRLKLVSKINCF